MPYIASNNQPARWPYYVSYLALSVVAAYHMRVGPPSQLTGKILKPFLTSTAAFTHPGRSNVVMRRHYTGVKGIDGFLGMLVTAFLAGTAGFQKQIQVQQINFLYTFAPFLAVISIEAVRSRKWSSVIFTSLWALLYQTLGGAIIIPLYFLAHGRTFGNADGARLVPVSWAKTLLPALTLGYLLPTALMFYPFGNIEHTMLATASWQPSPFLLNVVWFILKTFSSEKGDAQKYIRRVLVVGGIVAATTHIGTLSACFSSSYPSINLSSIFLPRQRLATSFEEATHFIFQVDYLIISLGVLIWALQTRAEDRARAGKRASTVLDVALLSASAAALGPGATLAWVWYGRQGRMRTKNQ